MLHGDPPSGSRPLRLSLEKLKTIRFINHLAVEWIVRSSFRTWKAAHSLKALVRVADGPHWPATPAAKLIALIEQPLRRIHRSAQGAGHYSCFMARICMIRTAIACVGFAAL